MLEISKAFLRFMVKQQLTVRTESLREDLWNIFLFPPIQSVVLHYLMQFLFYQAVLH